MIDHLFKSPSRLSQYFKSTILCVLLIAFVARAHAEQAIPVWTYYPSAPFITAQGQGLSYDFIQLLNEYSQQNGQLNQYHFELKPLPRTRINRNLAEGIPGMVLFVNWAWMGDKNKTEYLWSGVILTDRNEIASRSTGKQPIRIEYEYPDSLKGMVFGGVTGRFYKGLEGKFKSGDIIRRDVRQEELNLDLLLRGRIDFTSISSSVLNYKVREKGIQGEIHYSSTPLISYTRHLLITKTLASLAPEIESFVSSLEGNPKWHAIKRKYAVR